MSISGGHNKARKENEERVAEEYYSSLSDLNCNSKPLINMLTMLAEENIEYAPVIVKVVADHIHKVPSEIKLPILYLIDSIVKNVKSAYVTLFSQCIVNIFCHVFEKVNEKTRERMYALRHTWHEVFSPQKLYALDVQVKKLDNNWPITAKPPQPSIHVNPNFLKPANAAQSIPSEMEEILQAKTRELLELRKRKLELELEATKKHLEEQEKQLSMATDAVVPMSVDVIATPQQLEMDMGIPGVMDAGVIPAGVVFNQQFRSSKGAGTNIRTVPGLPAQLEHPSSGLGHQASKQKVFPVHPAMVQAMRSRDPRLLRQQQPTKRDDTQSEQLLKSQQTGNCSSRKAESGSSRYEESASSSLSRSSHKTSGSSRNSHRGRSDTRAESKSSHSRRSPSSSSSYSSASRLGKSYTSRSKNKERERSQNHSDQARQDRKRHDAKTTSASSPTANDRRRITGGGIVSCSPIHSTKKYHQDSDSDIKVEKIPAALSSIEPKSNYDVAKIEVSIAQHTNANKDVDLRQTANVAVYHLTPSPSPTTSTSAISNEFNCESTIASIASPQKMTTAILPPNASQIIDKSSAPTSATPTTGIDAKYAGKPKRKATERSSAVEDMPAKPKTDEDDEHTADTKSRPKRPAMQNDGETGKMDHTDDEKAPANKKAKTSTTTTNMDILFGEEDVDLRTTLQAPGMIARPAIAQPMAASNKKTVHDSPELKTSPKSPRSATVSRQAAKKSPTTRGPTSNLDDVRAKLAKAARLNNAKMTAPVDRPTTLTAREQTAQRLKLAELNSNNEDLLEDNDEKIRTIMAQAQELLDSKSISHEQYKNLVHTVMSINETNKLKEAKRRESFNVGAPQSMDIKEQDNENCDEESDRRREAVLKKRIPKLNKKLHQQQQQREREREQQPLDRLQVDLSEVAVASKDERADNPFLAPQRDPTGDTLKTKTNGKEVNHSGKLLKIKWNDRANKGAPKLAPGTDFDVSKLWAMGTAGPNKNRFGVIEHPKLQTATIAQSVNQSPWHLNQSHAAALGGNIPPLATIGGIAGVPPPLALPMGPIGQLQPPRPCNSIDNPQADLVRTITIDSMAKEIRIYDQVAIVFMELDQPREIGFKSGQRAIFVDNQEPIVLHFNDTYRTFAIGGETHQLRFGFPSRELYIDDQWYEIYFGGPPITIPISNGVHFLKAEGPPPQVNIGPLRRDLVVGKINMIVDAHIVVPLFLDAKVQTFQLGDRKHSLQFADQLLTVLLDGTPMQVEYGGLPKSIMLSGRKYFIRFGTLPQHVIAGQVQIKGMLYVNTTPKVIEELPAAASLSMVADGGIGGGEAHVPLSSNPSGNPAAPIAPVLANLNIDELFQKLVSSGILSGGGSSGAATSTTTVVGTKSQDRSGHGKKSHVSASAAVAGVTPTPAIPEPEAAVPPVFDFIDLSKPESVKTRQQAIIGRLFSGMQCGSCGLRFSPEQTVKYSQHLDWHFRLNRRERDLSRKAHSRKWYYDLNDWVQYEEIEEVDEKNMLEVNQNDGESNMDEASNHHSVNSPIQSCPTKPEDVNRMCDMCQEPFEQFYHEELEEWHLRSAIRVDDKIYHQLCYEDYKTAQTLKDDVAPPEVEGTSDDNAMDTIISVPDASIIVDEEEIPSNGDAPVQVEDVDDDVILLPNEEPMITEIDDDDDCEGVTQQQETTANAAIVETGEKELNADQGQTKTTTTTSENLNDTAESDVEIQEPNIPFTDLDTYVEKEPITTADDITSDGQLLNNIKIKKEPKDSFGSDDDLDDEDDGFEEVGTVISPVTVQPVHIPEKVTTADTISDSVSLGCEEITQLPESEAVSAVAEKDKSPPTSATGINGPDLDDADISAHNLSASGTMAPSMPIANLINKIKINISTNSSGNAVAAAAAEAKTNATSRAVNSLSGHPSTKAVPASDSNSISGAGVSSIPVLCSGVASTATLGFSAISTIGGGGSKNSTTIGSDPSKVDGIDSGKGGAGGAPAASASLPLGNVSNISVVIGSNYDGAPPLKLLHGDVGLVVHHKQVPTTITVPTVETTEPVFELKPSLQKAALKKRQPVNCGVDTSGLCSIM